jgi:hypothetical protein
MPASELVRSPLPLHADASEKSCLGALAGRAAVTVAAGTRIADARRESTVVPNPRASDEKAGPFVRASDNASVHVVARAGAARWTTTSFEPGGADRACLGPKLLVVAGGQREPGDDPAVARAERRPDETVPGDRYPRR